MQSRWLIIAATLVFAVGCSTTPPHIAASQKIVDQRDIDLLPEGISVGEVSESLSVDGAKEAGLRPV